MRALLGRVLARAMPDTRLPADGVGVRRLPPRDVQDTRTAVHEAGHLVAAWCCTGVCAITRATIERHEDKAGGVLIGFFREEETDDDHWCRVVIDLAGIAAEGLVFGRTSRGASQDLSEARWMAAVLAARDVDPEAPPGPNIDFRPAFVRPKLTTLEASILVKGYRVARELVRLHGRQFDRVVSTLLAKRTIDEVGAAEVLGPRASVAFLGTMRCSIFVPPRRST